MKKIILLSVGLSQFAGATTDNLEPISNNQKSIANYQQHTESFIKECDELYQSWVFNNLLEEACDIDGNLSTKLGIYVKDTCQGHLSEKRRDDLSLPVMESIKHDVESIGSEVFCAENIELYTQLEKGESSNANDSQKKVSTNLSSEWYGASINNDDCIDAGSPAAYIQSIIDAGYTPSVTDYGPNNNPDKVDVSYEDTEYRHQKTYWRSIKACRASLPGSVPIPDKYK